MSKSLPVQRRSPYPVDYDCDDDDDYYDDDDYEDPRPWSDIFFHRPAVLHSKRLYLAQDNPPGYGDVP